jgi:hypothetical protein
LLLVVGDVSGKGIAAAMLVAVLVGTIRTRADETVDPAAILETLNDRLPSSLVLLKGLLPRAARPVSEWPITSVNWAVVRGGGECPT